MSTRGFNRAGRLYYRDSALAGSIWPAIPEVFLYDDFLGINTTDIATQAQGFTGTLPGTVGALTIVPTAGIPGTAKLTSGTADNDHGSMTAEVQWYGKYSACFECRVTLDNINAGLMIGFTDVSGLANAGPIILSTTVFSKTTVDGAMFVYDAHADNAFFYCQAVKNTTTNTAPILTTIAPVAGTYRIFRVELEDTGTATNAKFYIDGVLVGTLLDCLTRTVAMTPCITVGARNVAARYALIDYCKAWQRRT